MALQRANLAEQLAKLQSALDAAEEKSHAQEIRYVEMSTRLNRALADKVAELNDMSKYQSAFYRAVKMAIGDRTTVQSDGDRFIVNSDILFPSGSYKLSEAGKKQLYLIANVIKDMENKIPTDIDWIIRVDGHTDKKPVINGTRGYKNNTQLSLLRATAVANELANAGVSRRRLVPSGFGDLHPVELGNDAASLQKNRRIELQLTNK
jgi:chemotaxis protein MotB